MAELNEEEAAKLHREKGVSYGELAKLVGRTKGSVYKRVKPAVEEMGGEPKGEEQASGRTGEETKRNEPTIVVPNEFYKWIAVAFALSGLCILALALI